MRAVAGRILLRNQEPEIHASKCSQATTALRIRCELRFLSNSLAHTTARRYQQELTDAQSEKTAVESQIRVLKRQYNKCKEDIDNIDVCVLRANINLTMLIGGSLAGSSTAGRSAVQGPQDC